MFKSSGGVGFVPPHWPGSGVNNGSTKTRRRKPERSVTAVFF